jgi:hypothetical protein
MRYLLFRKQPARWIFPVLFFSFTLFSETLFVYYGVEQSGSGLSWKEAKKSIEEAIAASQPFDAILVGYDESGSLYTLSTSLELNHPLRIRSARFDADSIYFLSKSDSSLCILDAEYHSRLLTIRSESSGLSGNTEIRGFTLINGNASDEKIPDCGGAVLVSDKARVVISGCQILNNRGSDFTVGTGGGLCCMGDSSFLDIQNCLISQNRASLSGPGQGGGIAVLDSASAHISNTILIDNTAGTSAFGSSMGGGVYGEGTETVITVSSSQIRRNSVSGDFCGGGGIAIVQSEIRIQTCEIDSNTAVSLSVLMQGFGGGLYFSKNRIGQVQNNRILRNTASGHGGGLAALDFNGIIQQNEIRENLAADSPSGPGKGGGVYGKGRDSAFSFSLNTVINNSASNQSQGYGGGLCFEAVRSILITQCAIDSNTASHSGTLPGYGGGFCLSGDSSNCVFSGNQVRGNSGSEFGPGCGGGLAYLAGAAGTCSGNEIAGNVASYYSDQTGMGGGIFCSGLDTHPSLINNQISDNRAALSARGYGGGIALLDSSQVQLQNNIISRNHASESWVGFGGGIACGNTANLTQLRGNQFNSNLGSAEASGFGGGVYFSDGAFCECVENTFTRNIASESALDVAYGGALCLENASATPLHVRCFDNHFKRNQANQLGHGRGGALSTLGFGILQLNIQYNVFQENRAGGLNYGYGGALYLEGSLSESTVRNNDFLYNHTDSTEISGGLGADLYLTTQIPDTVFRNNCMLADSASSIGFALYSLIPLTITHNAFQDYLIPYNDQITSAFEVAADLQLNSDTWIPEIGSPLIDSGYDPVYEMNERHSGWFVDIGACDFMGTEFTRQILSEGSHSFPGQVRTKVEFPELDQPVSITFKVTLQSEHVLAYRSLPRWYRISCSRETGGGLLTLSYTDSECEAQDEHTLRLWHFNIKENRWEGPFFSARDTAANWIQAPFSVLSGDWIITDARDMNALASSSISWEIHPDQNTLQFEWFIEPRDDIIETGVWTSENGLDFIEIVDSRISIDPGAGIWAFTYELIPDNTQSFFRIAFKTGDGRVQFSSIRTGLCLPESSELGFNMPNPFNQQTRFTFSLSQSEAVRFEIRDIRGRLIKSLMQKTCPPGIHQITWDGSDESGSPLCSGTYIYQLKTSTLKKCRKLVIIR